ncbi:MAG TPA: response regulator [Terriglobia bacterium]|nr:response regulator [Terriglobia bacterium]
MSLKIMVVDDEPKILEIIKAFVDPLGCEVSTFQDSRDAAKTITRQKFDGIFVDANMPYLDGFELTQCIRESPSNSKAPVVMLTGCDDVETMRRGFKAGITIFLGKPVTQERMVRAINALRGAFLREKRKYVRLAFHALVACKWNLNGSHQSNSSGLDISEGGMGLGEAPRLGVGHNLDLDFSLLATPSPLKLHARVVREMPPNGLGVEFVDLSPADRMAIQRYITGAIKG